MNAPTICSGTGAPPARLVPVVFTFKKQRTYGHNGICPVCGAECNIIAYGSGPRILGHEAQS